MPSWNFSGAAATWAAPAWGRAPMFAKRLVMAAPDRGKCFEVLPYLALGLGGSREADARLADPRVSPLHCQVSVRDRQIYVADMDSLVGTSVNNIFVTTEYPV